MPSNSNSNSRETMSAHTSLNRRMASRSLLSAHFALRGDDVINRRGSLQPLGGGEVLGGSQAGDFGRGERSSLA